MKIIIDGRERDLVAELISLSQIEDGIEVVCQALEVGDIMIVHEDYKHVVLERKTIADLEASIKDGRYKEQSMRLMSLDTHSHNICYLIEGDIEKHKSFRMDRSTIYSTLFSIQYYKGFSLIRTNNLHESANYIYNCAKKIKREQFKRGKYQTKMESTIEEEKYTSVIKTCKKENITPDNIDSMMLSQIPSISMNISIKLLSDYHTVYNLIGCVMKDEECLKSFTYENDKNQTKKLNKTCIANIKKYLIRSAE